MFRITLVVPVLGGSRDGLIRSMLVGAVWKNTHTPLFQSFYESTVPPLPSHTYRTVSLMLETYSAVSASMYRQTHTTISIVFHSNRR